MKNKLYYILFVCYALVVVLILYINGIFSGDRTSAANLIINGVFLLLIGVLFAVSAFSFLRLNRCTDELVRVTAQINKEYDAKNGKNLWDSYQDRSDLFREGMLKEAFLKYLMRMKNHRTRYGYMTACDVEEYINEDLLDQAAMSYFNSGISGTLTGLGILGTFLGLSMGLGSFNGDDIYTISDNVGPLLSGMKVAFHTSVYGIFFSLVFNFVYRSIMSDAYEKLSEFQTAFRQCVMPVPVTEMENSSAMLVYQANMAGSMKRMLDLLQGNALEQTQGVERIINQVMTGLEDSLGVNFKNLGDILRESGEAQTACTEACRELLTAASKLLEANRTVQEAFKKEMDRQETFAKELRDQKADLAAACKELTEDVGNQLYTFNRMRNLYEK